MSPDLQCCTTNLRSNRCRENSSLHDGPNNPGPAVGLAIFSTRVGDASHDERFDPDAREKRSQRRHEINALRRTVACGVPLYTALRIEREGDEQAPRFFSGVNASG